jgi:GrpB-like predicted nucleotidyltransferase (UPF0157 family)
MAPNSFSNNQQKKWIITETKKSNPSSMPNKWMHICKLLYGDSAVTIERIGSSAIPGMPGTAAVDFVIGSTNFPPT